MPAFWTGSLFELEDEAIVLGWVVRGLLIVAGFLASWFVAKDAPQFGLMQMAVSLLLFVLVLWVLAFWPQRWTHMLNRVDKPR